MMMRENMRTRIIRSLVPLKNRIQPRLIYNTVKLFKSLTEEYAIREPFDTYVNFRSRIKKMES